MNDQETRDRLARYMVITGQSYDLLAARLNMAPCEVEAVATGRLSPRSLDQGQYGRLVALLNTPVESQGAPPSPYPEDQLAGDARLNLICALLCYMPESDLMDYDPGRMLDKWNHLVASLRKRPWVDGRHYGDCTGEPITCARCRVDDALADARLLLEENDEDI